MALMGSCALLANLDQFLAGGSFSCAANAKLALTVDLPAVGDEPVLTDRAHARFSPVISSPRASPVLPREHYAREVTRL